MQKFDYAYHVSRHAVLTNEKSFMGNYCVDVVWKHAGYSHDNEKLRNLMPKLWANKVDAMYCINVSGEALTCETQGLSIDDTQQVKLYSSSSKSDCCISLTVTREKILIDIDLQLTAIQQVFFHRDAHGRAVITTDARILRTANSEAEADAKTLYALMQFGCCVAPFGPWKHVQRLLPGHRHRISIDSRNAVLSSEVLDVWSKSVVNYKLPVDALDDAVRDAIDTSLANCVQGKSPVILFSGGVDSSLMVARLKAMGCSDLQGVHYCISDTDPSTMLARQMAKALQLPLEVVGPGTNCSVDAVAELVTHFGNWYASPFVDHSAVPTSALSRIVAAQFSADRPILDGTGADGLFGLAAAAHAWRKVYQIPNTFRLLAGKIYSVLNMYSGVSKSEYRLRVLRRSALLPFPLSMIANNPLRNVAYKFDQTDVSTVHEQMLKQFHNVFGNHDETIQASVIDVVHVCCAIFAQKDYSFFNQSVGGIQYPFLCEEVAKLAWNQHNLQDAKAKPKAVLKRILAKSVPAELVYHKKLGFVDNLPSLFKHPAVQNEMKKLTDCDGVMGSFIKPRVIDQLRERMARKQVLPSQTYNCLWGAVAINAWYRPVMPSTESKDKGV